MHKKKSKCKNRESKNINSTSVKDFTFVNPVDGILTSAFGYRINPISKKKEFHNGIDIAAGEGSEIRATDDCVVQKVGSSKSFGNFVECKSNDGYQFFYGHLQKILVKQNDQVHKNQIIALSGKTGFATGPHLHYSIKFHNEFIDPLSFVKLPWSDDFKKEYFERNMW